MLPPPAIRGVANSTQLVNQARAFLLERGVAVPQGKRKFAERLPEILEDADNGLPDAVRELVADMLAEWEDLEVRIANINRCLRAEAQANEACRRLLEVPGIGPQTATALVATIDNGSAFEQGRDFAAWLGLTPRESSTGGKQRLGAHQQAREQVPAHAAGALRPRRSGDAGEARGPAGSLAAAAAGEQGAKRRDRGAGGPPGADRLGAAAQGRALQAPARGRPCGLKRGGSPGYCKREESKLVCTFGLMDKQVVPAYSENLSQAMALGGR